MRWGSIVRRDGGARRGCDGHICRGGRHRCLHRIRRAHPAKRLRRFQHFCTRLGRRFFRIWRARCRLLGGARRLQRRGDRICRKGQRGRGCQALLSAFNRLSRWLASTRSIARNRQSERTRSAGRPRGRRNRTRLNRRNVLLPITPHTACSFGGRNTSAGAVSLRWQFYSLFRNKRRQVTGGNIAAPGHSGTSPNRRTDANSASPRHRRRLYRVRVACKRCASTGSAAGAGARDLLIAQGCGPTHDASRAAPLQHRARVDKIGSLLHQRGVLVWNSHGASGLVSPCGAA
jgi:hypothetical protein